MWKTGQTCKEAVVRQDKGAQVIRQVCSAFGLRKRAVLLSARKRGFYNDDKSSEHGFT